MLQPVAVGHKTLADYTHICGRELIAEIRELAEPLQGERVVHISATAFGGGVSEILYTLVPLMRDVGLDCEWQVIYGREEFFNATKLMHNALQGAPQDLDEEQWATWLRFGEINARELTGGWDVALVHDPQPAALHQLVPEKAKGWVWRCHIDLSTPNPQTMARMLPYIAAYPHVPLPHARVRARGDARARARRAAGDRSPHAEEHGALARRRRVRVRAVRDRRRSPANVPGLAL